MRQFFYRLCAFALACSSQAHAIEAPKGAAAPPPPVAQPAQPPEVTPTDESDLYAIMQRVSRRELLAGLKVSDEAVTALIQGKADEAVTGLTAQANRDDFEANVALVRIQRWCAGIARTNLDSKARLSKLSTELPAERLPRAAGVLQAQESYLKTAKEACARARFDFPGIEGRLRRAAAAGNPPSATELAYFTGDPKRREELLQSAADKGYIPAIYTLAVNRLLQVQRGESTAAATIRPLLKQALRELPDAKLDLANCMAYGCDGRPADTLNANSFGVDAARDGHAEAFASMVRLPWGERMPREQLLAWQYFGNRLNESGCLGDAYLQSVVNFSQTIQQLETNQSPELLARAKELGEKYWSDYSARAKRAQRCE
jgi:hypothetical protein